MKDIRNKLITGALALSITISPLKKIFGEINGWFEATKGIEQGNNLRVYPEISLGNLKYNSLIDVNKFYPFGKHDFSHEKIKIQINKNYFLKPLVTLHTNNFEKKVTAGANLSYNWQKGFGFYEMAFDFQNPKNPLFFTYDALSTKIGNIALFTAGTIKDLDKTYSEVEFTGKEIANFGVSPYVRGNFQKGVKPTYQIGISVQPKKVIQRIQGMQFGKKKKQS